MSLTDLSIKRPVAMSCVLIALTLLGFNAYRKMSLENLPKFDIPYVSITTKWVGATPEDMEIEVAKRIEDAVSGLDGLKHTTTICMENVCNVILEFHLGTNVDVSAVDVREKIDAVLDDLPSDSDRPVIQKINVNATSVCTLCLTGELSVDELYDYADHTLADKFSTIPGVAKVDIVGGNTMEAHIELDRKELQQAGLTSLDVVQALQMGILSIPAGRVIDHGQEISVKFNAEYQNIADLSKVEVANANGVRRTLGSLGVIRMAPKEVRTHAFVDNRPCIVLKIIKKAEGNTVTLVENISRRVNELKGTLPAGMDFVWFADSGEHIRNTVNNTLGDIVTGILICAVLLFIFLANVRTTVIVIISMPLTIIMSFFFMQQVMNYTFNVSTLLAIGLSIGVLVSNSIVVIENIIKHLSTGTMDPKEAARFGTNEVAIAVTASAGTNVVVMLPIGMMSSLVGLFFTPFAVTTLILNVMSIFISLTLTPMLCSILLRKEETSAACSPLRRAVEKWLAFQASAGRGVSWVIRQLARSRIVTFLLVALTVLALFHSFTFAGKLGVTFMETADRGKIFVKAEFPIDYDLEKTTGRILAIQKRLVDEYKDKDLIHALSASGKTDSFGSNSSEAVYLAQIQLRFKDKTHRDWNIFDRVNEISTLLADETDCIITVAVESEMGGLSSPINIEIHGDEFETLDTIGRSLTQMIRSVDGVGDVDSSVRDSKKQILVTPKRAVLSDRGMTPAIIAQALRGNLEGLTPTMYKRGDRSFRIRVKFQEVPGINQVRDFTVPGGRGTPVSLESVATVEQIGIPVQIFRKDKSRMAQVTGTMTKDGKLGLINESINRKVAESDLIPTGYSMNYAGDSEYMAESIADFLEAAILAVLLTYLTLSAILESFTRPFLIMFTLPMGIIGILWGLRLANKGISIMVMLGIVMLIGVVVNAAVLIIDKLDQLRKGGMSSREAMIQAVGQTFRSVLMVILASAMGMLPMAIANGIGSEMRNGIGIASTGGVLVAGFLTFTILPLVYLLFAPRDRQA